MKARRGQAMVESLIAVLAVTIVFLLLFWLSRLLTGKILLEHAAMRVARARAVGLNEAVCRRVARVATIPIAGKREWPEDDISDSAERARVAIYLAAPDEGVACRVLDFANWDKLTLNLGDERSSSVSFKFGGIRLKGEAGIEPHASYYLTGGR